MPTIRITRSNEFINRIRDYGIYVDDVKRGTIANGKTIMIEVAPGTHTLSAKIDWTWSPTRTFTISEADAVTFKVGGFKGARWILPLIIVLAIAGPPMKATLHFEHFYLLALPLFLLLIYYITIGRKQYLSLTEEAQEANKISPAQTAY